VVSPAAPDPAPSGVVTTPPGPAESAPAGSARGIREGLRALFGPPPTGRRIAALDGARAVAVLVVVIHHAWLGRCGLFRSDCQPALTGEPLSVYALGLFFGHGDLGVDIFFVLSGYLIFSVLYRAFASPGDSPPRAIGRFLARRFLRIYPALALMIPLNMIFFAFLPGVDGGAGPLLEGCRLHAWSNYLLVNNVAPLGGGVLDLGEGPLGCVPWTWSVAIEWQFYLLSPLLVWRYARLRTRAHEPRRALAWWQGSGIAVALFALSLAACAVVVVSLGLDGPGLSNPEMSAYMTWLYTNPLTRCTPYLIGMAAAAYRMHFDTQLGPASPGGPTTPLSVVTEPGAPAQTTACERERAHPSAPRHVAGLPSVWWSRWAVFTILSFFLLGVLPLFPWSTLNLYVGVLGRTLFSAAVALILVVGAAPEAPQSRITRFLRHRVWHPLAQASYSVYLWQFVGIEAARWGFVSLGVSPDHGPLVWMGFALASIATSFALGAASFVLVERPTLSARPAG